MAQDIELLGAVFNDVPAVELPQVGGGVATFTDTSDATLTDPAMLRTGNTAYANGELITGTMPDATVTSSGLVTASRGSLYSSGSGYIQVYFDPVYVPITVSRAGYISSDGIGTISVLGQVTMTTKSAQTYTPTTTNQTISSNQFLTGAQTIKGDSNLKPENIKAGVSIFGVQGSSAVATATVSGTTLTLTDGFPVEVI